MSPKARRDAKLAADTRRKVSSPHVHLSLSSAHYSIKTTGAGGCRRATTPTPHPNTPRKHQLPCMSTTFAQRNTILSQTRKDSYVAGQDPTSIILSRVCARVLADSRAYGAVELEDFVRDRHPLYILSLLEMHVKHRDGFTCKTFQFLAAKRSGESSLPEQLAHPSVLIDSPPVQCTLFTSECVTMRRILLHRRKGVSL
jgi:hypothetical protein